MAKEYIVIEKQGENCMDVIIILIALVALALAALRWGANSTEGMESPESDRRWRWYDFY